MNMLIIKNFDKISTLDGVKGTIDDESYNFRVEIDSLDVIIYRKKIEGKYEVHIRYDWSTNVTLQKINASDIDTLDKMDGLLNKHRLPF